MVGVEENKQKQGRNAGPSTALRSAQDDTFMVGVEENKQKQGQMQVLRLRCASLRMTHFMVGAEENKQKQGRNAGPSTPLRSAQDDTFYGGCGGEQAKARANAGPSTALRFAQDDNFMVGAEENKQKQGQMQVLRLRCASLRMTHFMVGAEGFACMLPWQPIRNHVIRVIAVRLGTYPSFGSYAVCHTLYNIVRSVKVDGKWSRL
jgi:hypothetical protein